MKRFQPKNLKSGYTSNNFLILNVCLKEKGPPVKIRQLSISKDHHIIAKSGPTAIGL